MRFFFLTHSNHVRSALGSRHWRLALPLKECPLSARVSPSSASFFSSYFFFRFLNSICFPSPGLIRNMVDIVTDRGMFLCSGSPQCIYLFQLPFAVIADNKSSFLFTVMTSHDCQHFYSQHHLLFVSWRRRELHAFAFFNPSAQTALFLFLLSPPLLNTFVCGGESFLSLHS